MAIYKLGNISLITKGVRFEKGKVPFPFLGSGDVSPINYNNIKYFKTNIKVARKGTILLGIEATTGVIGIVDKDVVTNQAVAHITVNEKIIYRKFATFVIPKYIKTITKRGSIYKTIRLNDLKQLKMKIPTMKIQKEIIDIIEPLENQIINIELILKKMSKLIKFKMDNELKIIEKMNFNCKFIKGLNIPKNKSNEKKVPFLNVSAANGKINKFVNVKENTFIGDVTLSLDGNTGLVNNSLSGYNGYLYNIKSNKFKKYQIYYSLKSKINQRIIKINETGTTIKHSPNSKKNLVMLEIPKYFIEFYDLEIKLRILLKKMKWEKEKMINLLIK